MRQSNHVDNLSMERLSGKGFNSSRSDSKFTARGCISAFRLLVVSVCKAIFGIANVSLHVRFHGDPPSETETAYRRVWSHSSIGPSFHVTRGMAVMHDPNQNWIECFVGGGTSLTYCWGRVYPCQRESFGPDHPQLFEGGRNR